MTMLRNIQRLVD